MSEIIWQSLVASLVVNIGMFFVAFKNKTDKLTDISYALTFFLIACFALFRSSSDVVSQAIFVAVTIWSTRLGGFLLYRVWKKGKDARFDQMRGSFIKFGRFWLLQGITVWVVMLGPVMLISNIGKDRPFSASLLMGLLVFSLGLLIESIADVQKYNFSLVKSNKEKWIQEGVWKYSRHPNYFGEMLVWLGLFMAGLQYYSGVETAVAFISPLFIFCLLMFVSGVPILERNADKKWGSDPEYKKYKKRTSLIVLLPNKK